jgi:tRNA A-37 threonylcarbamoyl transferase component Bud32/FixJ family two-component response regulator
MAAMRFLIVDESSQFRRSLGTMLRACWPGAETEEWDPKERGSPGAAVARGGFSAVLMDSRPGGADGTEWVAEIRQDPNAPLVVLLAAEGGENLAVKAMKAGAADYLRKADLTSQRLELALKDALRDLEQRRTGSMRAKSAFQHTVQLDARKIGLPGIDDTVHVKGEPRSARIAGHRTLAMIGKGGMAEVYLAEREQDGLQVAIKVLDRSLRDDEVFLKRFEREYKLMAGLRDPHIVRIFDQGLAAERPYIVMEYLTGGTLAVRIHERLASLAALRIVSQIARALDTIHSHGIVHRDLKPQNIMFRADGLAVLLDFGLARDVDATSNLTRYGEVFATPRYMSPEQCLGRVADYRSDLYSLGVIFYEMLTGKPPFSASNPADLVQLHLSAEPPRLPAHLAGYQRVLDRLLAKRAEDRYQSARELFATIAV